MFSVTFLIDPVASVPPQTHVPPAQDGGLREASGSPRTEGMEDGCLEAASGFLESRQVTGEECSLV